MRHTALWFLKSQMTFQISPKLSVARNLPQTYRQTVPQTRPCNSKASISKSVVGSWTVSVLSVDERRAQRATTILGDEMTVKLYPVACTGVCFAICFDNMLRMDRVQAKKCFQTEPKWRRTAGFQYQKLYPH